MPAPLTWRPRAGAGRSDAVRGGTWCASSVSRTQKISTPPPVGTHAWATQPSKIPGVSRSLALKASYWQRLHAFAEKMMPVAAAQGWPMSEDRPWVVRVHNYWVPGVGGRPDGAARARRADRKSVV